MLKQVRSIYNKQGAVHTVKWKCSLWA